MKVKVLREHTNSFGTDFEKKVGRVYEVDDAVAASLIRQKLVEESKPAAKKAD